MYKKIFWAASVLFITVASHAQKLKLSLAKGSKYEVITSTKTNSVAEVMGQSMESVAESATTENIEVKDFRNDGTDFTSLIVKILANASSMGQETSYDSDKKDNSGPMAESLDKKMGKVKNISVDANGKVLKEDKDEDANNPMMTIGTSSGVPVYVQNLIGHDMKTGSNWNDSSTTDNGKLKTVTTGTYTVQSVDGDIATVTFTGNQQISGVIEQMGQEMNLSGTNKISTKITVSVSTGLIYESSANITGNSTVSVQGMDIPVTVTNSITKKVKPLQ